MCVLVWAVIKNTLQMGWLNQRFLLTVLQAGPAFRGQVRAHFLLVHRRGLFRKPLLPEAPGRTIPLGVRSEQVTPEGHRLQPGVLVCVCSTTVRTWQPCLSQQDCPLSSPREGQLVPFQMHARRPSSLYITCGLLPGRRAAQTPLGPAASALAVPADQQHSWEGAGERAQPAARAGTLTRPGRQRTGWALHAAGPPGPGGTGKQGRQGGGSGRGRSKRR